MWGNDKISVLDWLALDFALQERMSMFYFQVYDSRLTSIGAEMYIYSTIQ